jgi:hypothetical protein
MAFITSAFDTDKAAPLLPLPTESRKRPFSGIASKIAGFNVEDFPVNAKKRNIRITDAEFAIKQKKFTDLARQYLSDHPMPEKVHTATMDFQFERFRPSPSDIILAAKPKESSARDADFDRKMESERKSDKELDHSSGVVQPRKQPKRQKALPSQLMVRETAKPLELLLSEISKIPDFEGRMEAFKKSAKEVHDPEEQQTNYEINLDSSAQERSQSHLQLVLNEGPYFSEAIQEESFPYPPSKSYFHFKVFERTGKDSSDSEPLLHVRLSKHYGEKVWTSKGVHYSGNEIGELYLSLESIFKVDMYVYDDAALKLELGAKKESDAKKKNEISLKKAAIGRDDGLTSYEKLGFSIIDVVNWKMLPVTHEVDGLETVTVKILNQCAKAYHAAFGRVRNTKLKNFFRFYNKYTGSSKGIIAVAKRVFGKKFNITTSDKTLKDLENAVAKAAVQKMSSSKELCQEIKDQLYLHNQIFSFFSIGGKLTKAEKQYWTDIKTLDDTRVLMKPAPPS